MITNLVSGFEIPLGSRVRFKDCGNIKEIMYSVRTGKSGSTITKVSNDCYINNKTGELCFFNHIENRGQDVLEVAASLCRLRDIINTNVTDVSFVRWCTLTYSDNMTDPKKLANDFKNFNKRCRSKFGHYEYITAAEPQGRGAWHLHCLFIFDKVAPFMPNDIVRDCWKQGFVTIKKLDDVDNVGAYLTAYLGDMELSEAIDNGLFVDEKKIKSVDFTDDSGKLQNKRYLKGGRLYMYPPKFNIYRFSRGIRKPDISYVSYSEAKKNVSSAKLTFSKGLNLVDLGTGFKNQLFYESYNNIRK